jgi:predicted RNase H-like HicB family nuclease
VVAGSLAKEAKKFMPYTEAMMELDYTYWKSNDGWYVGHLNVWPEHLTQGKDLGELEEMLADLYVFYKEEQAQRTTVKNIGRLKIAV